MGEDTLISFCHQEQQQGFPVSRYVLLQKKLWEGDLIECFLSHLFWFHCCTTSIELLILKSLQLDKTSEIIYSVFSQPERGCEGGE